MRIEVSELNRIKELRKKNNLTLKQLGQQINMLDSTLSQYENGKRKPKEAKKSYSNTIQPLEAS